MSDVAFRFLQASDFHLEQPIAGLAEIPESLREHCIDAPYDSAEKVFDVAVAERVDFLLLSGDIVDPRAAGPRALAFLQNQFERLNSHGIAGYWAGGNVDRPDAWPTSIRLPSGVHIFPRGRVEELTHIRADQPIASILGTSNGSWETINESEFRGDGSELFSIAVAYGRVNLSGTARQSVDYWALGGLHDHEPIGETTRWGNYSGSPQGRLPSETGPHGCLLVHVNTERKVRAQLTPTDTVRWLVEHVEVERDVARGDLEKILVEHSQSLASQNGDRKLIVDYRIHGAHRLAQAHRARNIGLDLAEHLRERWQRGQSSVWASNVEFDDAALPSEWYEEDSILGDFLRSLRDEITGSTEIERLLHAEAAAPHGLPSGDAAEEGWLHRWEQVVTDASVLGAQLLRPEAELSAPFSETRRGVAPAREMPT